MCSETYNGVLLPKELQDASPQVKGRYAAKVRRGNRAFLDAYWKLEDEARAIGLEMSDLEDASTA